MPKLKTHKATSKRFRRTKGGKGKLMRTRAGQGHLRRKKRKSRKRRFYRMTPVKNKGLRDRVRQLLPKDSSLDYRKGSEAEESPEESEGNG
ncbi:MAG: large ribosomal subunit protein bL35 [Anaerolineae bacterium]